MAHALESSRSFLYANPELELPRKRSEAFKKLIKHRALGKPVAYLTGQSEFWSLPIGVSPAVLIPRPETELLVESALQKIPKTSDWRIADLGTGSGAIALALASERKNCEIHATDISSPAIQIAQENASTLGIKHVQFHQGSWNRPLRGRFHMVVSNPPYIESADPHLLQGDLRFEPRKALTPGRDGLTAIRKISKLAHPILVDGGWLIFEHGYEQGAATREILETNGYKNIKTILDFQDHERVTIAEKP